MACVPPDTNEAEISYRGGRESRIGVFPNPRGLPSHDPAACGKRANEIKARQTDQLNRGTILKDEPVSSMAVPWPCSIVSSVICGDGGALGPKLSRIG